MYPPVNDYAVSPVQRSFGPTSPLVAYVGTVAALNRTHKAKERTVMRFTIVTATGEVVRGRVQGCGGVIDGRDALARLQANVDLANDGEPLGIYEPSPGCCSVHIDDDGERKVVSLVGAYVSLEYPAAKTKKVGR